MQQLIESAACLGTPQGYTPLPSGTVAHRDGGFFKEVMGRPRIPVEQRFWQQVTKTETCWTVNGYRYAKIKTGPPEKKTVSAHRFSWELHFGPVPAGLIVCHRCNNKLCVRPDHLYLATQKINIGDAIRDGLKPRWNGELNPKRRLTAVQAQAIRISQVPNRALAALYGVSVSTIQRIRNGSLWTTP